MRVSMEQQTTHFIISFHPVNFSFPLQSTKVTYLVLNSGLVFHLATAHRHISCPWHTLLLYWSFSFLEQLWAALPLLHILHHYFEHMFPDRQCPWETPLGQVRAPYSHAWTTLSNHKTLRVISSPARQTHFLYCAKVVTSPSLLLPFMVSSHVQHFSYSTRCCPFLWQGHWTSPHWRYTGVSEKQFYTVLSEDFHLKNLSLIPSNILISIISDE